MDKTPHNPSRKAIARVKNPLPAPTHCRYCESAVTIEKNSAIYGRDFGGWPWIYLCTNSSCRAYIGMHPFTAIPLGTMADQKLRDARKHCKPVFNQLWQSGKMTRTRAYQWLAEKMGIPAGDCHFGWFTVEECQIAKQICEGFERG